MFRKLVLFLALLSIAPIALADPVITSVSPIEGPVAGGTTVTIKGSGFSNVCIICSPPFGDPRVYFGVAPARSVRFIDANTIEAVTPASLPHTASIAVHQNDGSLTNGFLDDAFTFTGDPNEVFDAVLFPIFLPPVDGAYGSRFETTARVSNQSIVSGSTLYGLDTTCYLFTPNTTPYDPIGLGAQQILLPGCSTSTGRVFYLSKGSRMGASLRVRDLSRQAHSHGVEIPVVRLSEFTNDRVALLGVPADPRFRKTLRIYSMSGRDVWVSVAINGVGVGQVLLDPRKDLFEPAYGVFTDFPLDLPADSFMQVDLFMGTSPDGTIHPDTPRIWGFISVTNNETQEMTVISPQPD